MRIRYLAAAATLLTLPFPPSAAAAEPAATAAPAEPRYTPRMLTANEATRDVDLLIRALETVHPGLYRYTAKPEIDAAFAQLKAAASAPIT